MVSSEHTCALALMDGTFCPCSARSEEKERRKGKADERRSGGKEKRRKGEEEEKWSGEREWRKDGAGERRKGRAEEMMSGGKEWRKEGAEERRSGRKKERRLSRHTFVGWRNRNIYNIIIEPSTLPSTSDARPGVNDHLQHVVFYTPSNFP